MDYVLWLHQKKKLQSPLKYAKKVNEDFDKEEAEAEGWQPFKTTEKLYARAIAEKVREIYEEIKNEAEKQGIDIETISQLIPEKDRKQIGKEVSAWQKLYGVDRETAKKEARTRAWYIYTNINIKE